MNRTLNQLINQLHLDPKKEAAVRKIVENAGGINDSTPVVTEVSGNELVPIQQDGENKAVSAAALIKGAKELFVITPNSEGEFPTILTKDYLNSGMPVINALGAYLTKSFTRTVMDMGATYYEDFYIANPAFKSGEKAAVLIASYRPNKPDNPVYFSIAPEENIIPLFYNGDGTKFLSDDGTYKEVSGGGGPVIIEYPNGGNEKIAVTDEQINAVKNGNVKIKLTMTGTTNYIILAPISIAIMEEVAEIVVRSYFGENITDAILLVDFTNKTISIPE